LLFTNLLTLNSIKTEFFLIGLKQQVAKIHTVTLLLTPFTLLVTLTNISRSLTKSPHSKSCYSHIRQLRCIRFYRDSKAASTIATSIVHSKKYCNSLYYDLPKSQINLLHKIQNSLARAVVKASKFTHTTPILKSPLPFHHDLECSL